MSAVEETCNTEHFCTVVIVVMVFSAQRLYRTPYFWHEQYHSHYSIADKFLKTILPFQKYLPIMFLTLALLRKGIPGKQWIGKYRRPRQITWQMKRNMLKNLEREAENEYWISRPYMTVEQEYGHAAERRAQSWLKIKEAKFSNFPEHKHIADHLSHLKITKTWSS